MTAALDKSVRAVDTFPQVDELSSGAVRALLAHAVRHPAQTDKGLARLLEDVRTRVLAWYAKDKARAERVYGLAAWLSLGAARPAGEASGVNWRTLNDWVNDFCGFTVDYLFASERRRRRNREEHEASERKRLSDFAKALQVQCWEQCGGSGGGTGGTGQGCAVCPRRWMPQG